MTKFHPELTLLSCQQGLQPVGLSSTQEEFLKDLSAGPQLPLDLSNLHKLAKEVLKPSGVTTMMFSLHFHQTGNWNDISQDKVTQLTSCASCHVNIGTADSS